MVGAHVVMGSTSTSNQELQGATVHTLNDDYMAVPSSVFAIEDESVTEVDGRTILRFTRRDISDLNSTQEMLWSTMSESTPYTYHGTNRALFTVNFVTAENEGGGEGKDLKSLHQLHGFMMALGWGVLLPTGIFCARYFKNSAKFDPWSLEPQLWYRLHVSLQIAGLVFAIIGYIVALAEFDSGEHSDLHKNIGHSVIAIGLFQPLNGLVRPKIGAKFRRVWEWTHWVVGRGVIALAVYNIFLGFESYNDIYGDNSANPWPFVFVGWLALFGLVAIVFEFIEKPYARPFSGQIPANQEHEQAGTESKKDPSHSDL
eukprot:CAMPEP_0196584760 /NCGR_PEP_ID=MMETSP1081-20130531/48379_1 /TAXON_ID=36882 /ORGANISM="Pyramimonas amylifera, Strain CCMP720" /LENGTH=314 /DNA_ID=CAMNT_0041906091 /DNA_START=273 /DNA_END=1217 /DNA_ORIENTATION=+